MHKRRKTLHLTLIALGLLAMAVGCASLNLQLHNSSVQKPSNVALYFSVETGDGRPVGGLEATSFRIYEDDQLISPFESKQTILNPETEVVHYTLLLLDLSGSITESGSMHALMSAASTFAEKVTRQQKMAVYGFDGSAELIPAVNFTNSSAAVSSGLARLSSRRSRDPSTNLNGSVVEAVKVLEKALSSSKQPLRFATLIVFTDGTDRAHRVSEEEMHQVLDEANINVFSIGLGAEISEQQLATLGRNGFVKADEQANIGTAFDEIAARIENASRKFYLLSYCSPSRAGQHTLRVEVTAENQTGSLMQEFDATGFGPNCDPNRRPAFRIGRIMLTRRRPVQ
jgi:VWFA-related protein